MELLKYYRAERLTLLTIVAASFASALAESAGLVLLVPLGQAIANGDDRFSGGVGPFDLSAGTGVLTWVAGGLILASAGFALIAAVLRARAVARWEASQKLALYRAYLESTWETQVSERSGRFQELAGTYVTRGAAGLAQIAQALRSMLSLAVLIAAAIVIEPLGAAAVVALGGSLFVAFRPLARRVKRTGGRIAKVSLQVAEEMSEGVANGRDIKVFAATPAFADAARAVLQRQRRLRRRAVLLAGSVPALYQTAGLLALVAALGVAGSIDSLEIAEIGAIVVLMLRGLSYGQQFQNAYQSAQENLGYVTTLAETRAHYESAKERIGDGRMPLRPMQVELDGVGYTYPGADVPAISGITLSIKRGEVVGIAGPSGSGKTTLAQILLRLRRPTTGRVRVDGEDAWAYDAASWSRAVAFVPQDTRLIHGTIAENIRYFRVDVDDDAVHWAAAAAGIAAAVEALPDGFSTRVGPSDRNLSGGQIQRIGIARAFAGRPAVIVLDEPTSALDTASESIIQESLAAIRGEASIVIIAHRLSTLEICDRVVELAQGQVLRVATPQDVLPTLNSKPSTV